MILLASLVVALTTSFAHADLPEFGPGKVLADMVFVPAAGHPFYIDLFESQRTDSIKPSNFKTRAEAEAYCKAAGKRLATRAEWMLAASNNGANREFTGIGDRAEADGKPMFNIGGGKTTYSPNDFAQVGIDAVGTVGMTGNRPEWVVDGDRVVQCGAGYENKSVDDARLDKICSEEKEGRWARPEKTATARCVVDYVDGALVTLERSAAVTGKLKEYLATRPKPPAINNYYGVIKAACQEHKALVATGPLKDPLFEIDVIAFGVRIAGQGVFNCAYFGVDVEDRAEPKIAKEIDARVAAAGVTVPANVVANWLAKSADFKKNFHASVTGLQAAIARANAEQDAAAGGGGVANGAGIANVRALWRANRYQEAIWIAADQGNYFAADKLQGILPGMMEKDEVVGEKPFTSEGGVAEKYLLSLKSGMRAIFKPVGASALGGDAYQEVAAYRIDVALGLYLVPATVLRQDQAKKSGSAQYFVAGSRQGGNMPPAMAYFDQLIGNIDRHSGNYMTILDLQRVFAVDHNLTFRAPYGPSFGQIPSKRFLERLRAFGPAQMAAKLGDILNPGSMDYLKVRREAALAAADALVKSQGDRAFTKP